MTGTTTENDLCTSGTEDATETSGTIPTNSDSPYGARGTGSRDFESADTERLAIPDDGALDINGASDLTVCAWYKFESSQSFWTMVSKGSTGTGPTNQYRMNYNQTNDAGNFFKEEDDLTTTTAKGDDTDYDAGRAYDGWTHQCGTYDDSDSELRLFKNGIEDSNGADNPAATSSDLLAAASETAIGNAQHNASYINPADGLITEVIVLSRELSDDEIGELYAHGLDGTKRRRRF